MGELVIYKEKTIESNAHEVFPRGFMTQKGQGPPVFPAGLSSCCSTHLKGWFRVGEGSHCEHLLYFTPWNLFQRSSLEEDQIQKYSERPV